MHHQVAGKIVSTTNTKTQPKVVLQIMRGNPRQTFVLPRDAETRIGRGKECTIVLDDLRCSRVHAIIHFDPDTATWWLRDQGSSNGTFVNGSKVEECQLGFGADVRVGSVEFRFLQLDGRQETDITETVIMGQQIAEGQAIEGDAEQLRIINDFALRLLRCRTPDEVVACGLDVLLRHTGATVVGFLWSNEGGELRVHTMIPDQPDEIRLSEMLTENVLEKRRAVWVEGQTAHGNTGSLAHYADAICVPLVHHDRVLGAIHLYTQVAHYDESDFQLAIQVGSAMVAALVSARQRASLEARHERLVNQSAGFDELIGESRPMEQLKSNIRKIAPASGCVLIRGESGAGKELVARAMHRQGTRADRPMLSVNCAAIPRDLMESQLFGHKKGAFTGAEQDHDGWFKQADSGTLFLDEVGEMTLEGQAKLLRILEG
ncbi:MAG: sigma 54-interacting transcriptional regulator, partial [Planctomycetales bacterium]|nr:sigma 54-interacting transcriptional regulator [Planctomycetales bacterium]